MKLYVFKNVSITSLIDKQMQIITCCSVTDIKYCLKTDSKHNASISNKYEVVCRCKINYFKLVSYQY